MNIHRYIAIDLKSFYASVECVERGFDPLDANLVVADASRTARTICLAVSPSLKSYGVSGRPRLFEVVRFAREFNRARARAGGPFTAMSMFKSRLEREPATGLDYLVAPPRMALYLEYSARVYGVYLKFFAPDDINVYSVDEVFIDAAAYLKTYGLTARGLAAAVIREILSATGITAAAGIGSNLYLAKIALDIVAKHAAPDPAGARLGELDEQSYRRLLWEHTPITDFWRVGPGCASRLEGEGLYTMGDIARCSLEDPDLLYRLFGVNAELLIDHAWGCEPVTLRDIKQIRPERKSLSEGQVLPCPYSCEKALIIIGEMAEQLALGLTARGCACARLVLTAGYDCANLKRPDLRRHCGGAVTVDAYGRLLPRHARGTINLKYATSSARLIREAAAELFGRVVNPRLLIRRLNLSAAGLCRESELARRTAHQPVQLDLFAALDGAAEAARREEQALRRELKLQRALLAIKRKYGRNALLRISDLQEGATARQRNGQIGGHKA